MVSIPDAYMNRGPQGFGMVFTFLAEETVAVNGAIVTTGASDRTVKRCGASDTPIGWSAGKMTVAKEVDINLFAPVWKADVASTSDAISYGDKLAPAANGQVAKASATVAGVVLGIALSAAAASGQVLVLPIVSTPDPITT